MNPEHAATHLGLITWIPSPKPFAVSTSGATIDGVTEFGGEPQELDETDGPPPDADPDDDGAIKAWSVHSSSRPYFHGKQSVQLKTVGKTHKAASLSFWGSNPESPLRTRLEIEQ